jgi:hypothetical protein
MPMQVDMRLHLPVRAQVHAGIAALRVQGKQIWGGTSHSLNEVVIRLMVSVGDLSRATRDGRTIHKTIENSGDGETVRTRIRDAVASNSIEVKKELGNILFSTIRWIDDLGLDPLECLDLAIEAQEKFAKSGRAR